MVRDAGAGETDLGCGSKLVSQIRIARSLALSQDLNEMILIVVIKMMDGVSVIPVNTEILGCRL